MLLSAQISTLKKGEGLYFLYFHLDALDRFHRHVRALSQAAAFAACVFIEKLLDALRRYSDLTKTTTTTMRVWR